jgi:hypothetical protein
MGSAMGTRDYLKIRSIITFARKGGSFSPQVFSGPVSDRETEGSKRLQRLFLVLITDRIQDAHGGDAFEVMAAQ